ncbi:hypothetical protein [Spiroplasma endosymbiont of Apeira syringaria]|uniref:hypothetical protein n=1 Tax=Spiroplasma endosymbiont of Apeira syringaria TaxID=3066307 RepID=UPI0030CC0F58
MQDIAVQFEKHCWIHSVSLFPPQVHVGRSPNLNTLKIKFYALNKKHKNVIDNILLNQFINQILLTILTYK